MLKVLRKIRRAITHDEPGYYDMYLNKGEQFFARLYLHHIRSVIKQEATGPLKLLDAGCQTGRLAIPLAKDGHPVTGVDTSAVALHKAQNHARDAGVTPRWVRANLGSWLPKQPAGSFDAVLCNEVLYLRENWRELLGGLIRLLKAGGLCFISHRSPSFARAEKSGEGKVDGSYYNWQEREDLRRIYEESGIRVLNIVPIWQLSHTVNPEKVTEAQRDLLFQEEISAAAANGDGRYLLVCGKKR
ncbi:MAG: class I SAM-dependent methyltransferase [Candidatus Omnitrophota bacterium]|nr:class I SAM-dependent methyltransferase [Candidatus Omnitrophota bacterium]